MIIYDATVSDVTFSFLKASRGLKRKWTREPYEIRNKISGAAMKKGKQSTFSFLVNIPKVGK